MSTPSRKRCGSRSRYQRSLKVPGSPSSDVYRHQPRRRLVAHDPPLAPGGKTRAAEAAQARVFHRAQHVLDVERAGDATLQHAVTALRDVGGLVDRAVHLVSCHAAVHGGHDRDLARWRDRPLPHHRHRRLLAAPDAGCGDDSHLAPEQHRQARQQILRARELAAQAVADSHGQRRRRVLPLLDHVEVVIEGRDLVDLGLRQPHLAREGREMRRAEVAIAVLDLVQVLDQQTGASDASPRSARTSAAATGSTCRPLGTARRR